MQKSHPLYRIVYLLSSIVVQEMLGVDFAVICEIGWLKYLESRHKLCQVCFLNAL